MSKSNIEERLFKIEELASFDATEGKKTFFYETEKTAGALWCLEPGQSVFKHSHTTSDDLWICVQGHGTFYPGYGESVTIEQGDMIISRPGEQHGMENTGDERFIFVGVAGPHPMDLIVHED